MMKIEQVLHGYNEGHKMLASSLPALSPSNRRKMSVLSDWDEYVPAEGDDSSYLTCYPLSDSPYYVVAKTWYASEIERPGCVWTHSLLIDLGSMNSFFDLLSLLVMFKRPDKSNIDSYNEPIVIEKAVEREQMELQYEVMPSLNYWLFLLYSHQKPLLLTYQGDALTSQRFVLSLMNHVPKAMLHGMSLCSGSGRLRKFDNEIFDFQLTPESRSSILNLCGKTEGMAKLDGWYDNIAQSILQEDVDIPMLLARFSEEIGSNVDALAAVVMVFTRLDKLKSPGEENATKFMLILRIMATAFPNPYDGRYFKEVILSEDVIRFFFNEKEFIYLMAVNSFWRAFDYGSFDFEGRVYRFLGGQSLDVCAALMSTILNEQTDNPDKDKVLKLSIRDYSDDEVELLLDNYWKYYSYLARNNSRILNCSVWLTSERMKFIEILQIFIRSVPDNFDCWESLLDRVLMENAAIPEASVAMIAEHVPSAVCLIMERLNVEKDVNNEWVNYCKSRPQDILTWMAGISSLKKEAVRIILDTFEPDSDLVRMSDTAVWRCLLQAETNSEIKLRYCVFLFELSYNISRNDDAFKLYQKSFLPIYEASMSNKIDVYWMKIGPYCPRPFLGWEWDRCDMLRQGFAERLWIEKRDVNVAKRFTSKSNLNKQLYRVAQKRYHNKWF